MFMTNEAPARITHDALEGFISDTRRRIEALEATVYDESIFVFRIGSFEFRLHRVRRASRPDARLDRIRSEAR